jgi:hypothetical protein
MNVVPIIADMALVDQVGRETENAGLVVIHP